MSGSINNARVEKERYRLLNHKFHLFWLTLDRGIQKFQAKEAAACVCHRCPQSGPPSATTAHNGAYHKLLKSSARPCVYRSAARPIPSFRRRSPPAYGSIFRSAITENHDFVINPNAGRNK